MSAGCAAGLFYIIAAIASLLFLPAFGSALRMKWGITAVTGGYFLLVAVSNWVLQLFPAEPRLGPILTHITNFQPAQFPALVFIPAIAMDLVLQRSKAGDWTKAFLLSVAFVGLAGSRAISVERVPAGITRRAELVLWGEDLVLWGFAGCAFPVSVPAAGYRFGTVFAGGAGDSGGCGLALRQAESSLGEMDAKGATITSIKFMKRIFWLLVLLAGGSFSLSAHVGSPDVAMEGVAGPYRLLVSIKPPDVIPGTAQVTVYLQKGGGVSVTAQPISTFIPGAWRAALAADALEHDVAGRSRGYTRVSSG